MNLRQRLRRLGDINFQKSKHQNRNQLQKFPDVTSHEQSVCTALQHLEIETLGSPTQGYMDVQRNVQTANTKTLFKVSSLKQ